MPVRGTTKRMQRMRATLWPAGRRQPQTRTCLTCSQPHPLEDWRMHEIRGLQMGEATQPNASTATEGSATATSANKFRRHRDSLTPSTARNGKSTNQYQLYRMEAASTLPPPGQPPFLAMTESSLRHCSAVIGMPGCSAKIARASAGRELVSMRWPVDGPETNSAKPMAINNTTTPATQARPITLRDSRL